MARRKEPNSWTDPTLRLAVYWWRADLMRSHVHDLMDQFDRDVDAINDAGLFSYLETYLLFWLSALFVVVEGFNKLKIKDTEVQRLFNSHIQELKHMRHATYHFTMDRELGSSAIGRLEWAEELHDAIVEHIRAYLLQQPEAKTLSKKAIRGLKKRASKKKRRKWTWDDAVS